ncbi:Type I Iterative PKS [Diaporthe eres]
MACRLPGGINSASGLWEFLMRKGCAQGPVPVQRFNRDGFYNAGGNSGSRGGLMDVNGGYFLDEDVRTFDNAFFGIHNLEAASMDPQQRKLLEIVYECLEHAGTSLDAVSGTNTGVFVGNFTLDHQTMQSRDIDAIHRFSATGCGTTILANRISHVFNLQGPSLTLDTACSSSLYALHSAVSALDAGDCDAAVVAAVNLIMSPEQCIAAAKSGVLSPTSTCHTFDDTADGYGRAEGMNAIYLKRLSSAIRDGDKIWAVVRGTAVNANGKTPGITQPSAALQETVIRKAYSKSGLDFSGSDYVECHGTGTPVGDPIEVDALGRCFTSPTRRRPLLIGSSKPGLGHSEAASGLTALIKVALALSHAKVPPTYGVANLSSKPSSRSLATRLSQVRKVVEAGDTDTLRTLAYTLGERASNLNTRSVIYARCEPYKSPEVLNLNAEPEIVGTIGVTLPVAMVFTGQGAQYANMGKDLLLENEVFRRSIRSLDNSLRALLPPGHVPGWTLENAILEPPEASHMYEASRSQPVCTAIQIALVDLVRSWGINSCAVVGHSSGEIAAAYAAGLLHAPQAIIVAYFRGLAVDKITRKGAMLAAGIHADLARDLIQQACLDTEVSIACINSPESVTLSGSTDGIEHLMTEIQKQGKFARRLHTGQRAYHSAMIEEVGELYERMIDPYLDYKSDQETDLGLTTQMYSSVLASAEEDALILGKSSISARYWRQNLEQPVQFFLALSTLLKRYKKVHLVEVGPHPALKGPVQQVRSHLKRDNLSVPYSCTLIRDKNSDLCMKQLSGDLFLRNHTLSWKSVNCITGPGLSIELPPYPWDYSTGILWHEPRASIELRNRRHPRHELLGSQLAGGSGVSWAWRNVLNLDEVPWVRDHKLESQIVFPASAYLAMAIEALSQTRSTPSQTADSFEFRHVSISSALTIPDDDSKDGVELHTALSFREISRSSISQDWHDFSISSFAAGKATVHCSGNIRTEHSSSCAMSTDAIIIANPEGFEEWPNMSIWYHKFASEGLKFGPSFQSVEKLQTDSFRTRCEAKGLTPLVPIVSEGLHKPRYPMHPITIDACIQVAIMGSGAGDISHVHEDESFDAKDVVFPLVDRICFKTASPTAGCSRNSIQGRPFSRALGPTSALSQNMGTALELDRYISGFLAQCRDADMELGGEEHLPAMGALVDLAGHLNPRMRVLEIGDSAQCRREALLELLGDGTGFCRYKSWDSGSIDDTGAIQLRAGNDGGDNRPESAWDLLLVHTTQDVSCWIDHIDSCISDQGVVVAENTAMGIESLQRRHFTVTELPGSRVILASRLSIGVISKMEGLEAIFVLGKSPVPDLALSNGFSRALMLEQPSLNFVVLDEGPICHHDDITYANVARVIRSSCINDSTEVDKEFIQKDGLLYISRFGPDFDLNSLFSRRLQTQNRILRSKLSAAHPAKLALGGNGSGDTIHFEQVREPTSETPNGFIDVLVKAISLNPKDVYALQGRLETRGATTALEFSGVVTSVGPDVMHLKIGERVVVGMPCQFATSQRVPIWAAHKLLPEEQYTVMSTFPTIYGTALYALVHRAYLRRGESVLIHGGAGAFGFAAITIAKRILGTSTKIYTTAGSQARKRFIVEELAIPESNIFHSRTTSFAADIKSATDGHGVDVVINFLTGDLLRAGWECVSKFGRFVEVGKRDLLDAGRLDMHVFLQNATFTAFDFTNGFLDAFARWRRTQGKPAVSVGLGMISEVGYLHEHPEVEALLLRKGIQPLNEAEFLQVIDLALTGTGKDATSIYDDTLASGHILTGLEPLGFRQLINNGYDINFSSSQDPRLAILAAAFAAEQDAEQERSAKAKEKRGGLETAAQWLHIVPTHAVRLLESETDADSLQAAILRLITKRFSNLILTPVDQIDDGKSLARFGVDSMIASELRTWLWTAFKVDVPFLDILNPEKTLSSLAEFVETRFLDDSEFI